MSCDVANCIADVWFRLGFLSAADMAVANNWVLIPELYQFADDAVKALARSTGIFLTYDASINVLAGTASYALPATHVYTESAWLIYAGAPVQLLRLTGVAQLFALDANWPTTLGTPTRLSLDAQDVNTLILYPVPIDNSKLAQIMNACPVTVAAGSSVLPISAVLVDYFSDAMVAGARGKESDSGMPEVSAHLKQRMKLMDAVFEHLWGAGN